MKKVRPVLLALCLILMPRVVHTAAPVGAAVRAQAVDSKTVTAQRIRLGELRVAQTQLRSTAIARTNLPLANATGDPRQLKVFVQDASAWKRLDAIVTATNRNQVLIPTVANKSALTLSIKTNRETLTSRHLVLPFSLKSANNVDDWSRYQVEMHAEPSPARWLDEEKCYYTKIFVAILSPGQRTPAALPAPVQITLIGAGDAIPQPRELKLEKTLQFAEAEIRFQRADLEPRIDALPFTEDAPLLLAVSKVEALQVTLQPTTILGYGFGTSDLTVSRLDSQGRPLNEGPELEIKISGSAGRAEHSVIIPAGKSSVTTKLRSNASGADRITVRSGLKEAHGDIIYKEPWLFVGFALAGSLAGASARFLRRTKRKKGQLSRMLVEGCLAGVITTTAVCAGAALNILPASVQQTEIFAFIISAAVGMIGIKAIDWVKNLAPRAVESPTLERKEAVPEVEKL